MLTGIRGFALEPELPKVCGLRPARRMVVGTEVVDDLAAVDHCILGGGQSYKAHHARAPVNFE
ncbi:MAG TPA: hypothetical protein VJ045_09095, partial [Hyphomicrobiaceae bacterium]|nr:hypothetical protein [Hyphomicrobiaceae bacterium]